MKLDRRKYEALCERLIKEFKAASMVLGVSVKGETEYFGAGFSDIADGRRPTEHTLYQIGSCSKSFTAAAVCILAQEGRLELDAPIRRYMPELELADDYLTCNVTLTDALSHRTGLPDNDFSWSPFLDRYDNVRLISNLKLCRPVAPFRTRMIYNNQMYMLAGRVVERVSGMDWGEFVRERILRPLKMEETYTDIHIPKAAPLSCGYERIGEGLELTPHCAIYAMGPAGGIVSTASDLMKWIGLHINKGVVNGERILDWDMMARCHEPVTPIEPDSWDFTGVERKRRMAYGLGWYTEDYAGHILSQHSGYIDGYTGIMSMAPGEGIGVTALVNTGGSTFVETVPYYIFDECFGLEPQDHCILMREWFSAREGKEPPAPERVELAEYDKRELCGEYEDELWGLVKVFVQDSGIAGRIGMHELSFEHISGGGYFVRLINCAASGYEPIPAVFQTDAYGHVNALLIEHDESVVYKKKPAE